MKFRFPIVPADSPTLLEMTYIKLLDIPKMMCDVMEDPHEGRKFGSQTIQAFSGPSCKTNKT